MNGLYTQRTEYRRSIESQAGYWVPWAQVWGGSEAPFEYKGHRWQYVWNPAQKAHGYLDVDNGTVTREIYH